MPTWDGFLVSVLQVLRSGETVLARDLQDLVADHVGLTDAQRAEVIDSGQPRFRNRIGWAVSSLARAGAVERPRRGSYVITEVGQRLLAEHPDRVDEVDLRRIPAYRDHVPDKLSEKAFWTQYFQSRQLMGDKHHPGSTGGADGDAGYGPALFGRRSADQGGMTA